MQIPLFSREDNKGVEKIWADRPGWSRRVSAIRQTGGSLDVVTGAGLVVGNFGAELEMKGSNNPIKPLLVVDSSSGGSSIVVVAGGR